jgi:signal transduction histidine kinase
MVFLIIGILLTQLLYVIGNWRLHRSSDYLRYGLYITVFTVYLLAIFVKEVFGDSPFQETISQMGNLIRRPLSFVLYIVYYKFINEFLEFPLRTPQLSKLVKNCILLCYSVLAIQILLIFFDLASSTIGNIIYFAMSLSIILMSFYFLYSAFKDPIVKNELVLKGSAVLGLATLYTIFVAASKGPVGIQQQFPNDFIPFFLGIIIEIFFFNLAIAHKVRKQEEQQGETQTMIIDTLKKNAQLETDRQQIRYKMARDLHDELGAILSGVVLFSELSLRSIGRGQESEVNNYLKRIHVECDSMSNKMNDIVWATNKEHDTVEKLIDRLKGYATPLGASINTDLSFSIDEVLLKTIFNAEKRNHFYLFSKEALNNALKYSKARTIWYTATVKNDICAITIQDDGCGFNTSAKHHGNGLKNMQTRAKDLQGAFDIQSVPSKGTCITLKFPAYD